MGKDRKIQRQIDMILESKVIRSDWSKEGKATTAEKKQIKDYIKAMAADNIGKESKDEPPLCRGCPQPPKGALGKPPNK